MTKFFDHTTQDHTESLKALPPLAQDNGHLLYQAFIIELAMVLLKPLMSTRENLVESTDLEMQIAQLIKETLDENDENDENLVTRQYEQIRSEWKKLEQFKPYLEDNQNLEGNQTLLNCFVGEEFEEGEVLEGIDAFRVELMRAIIEVKEQLQQCDSSPTNYIKYSLLLDDLRANNNTMVNALNKTSNEDQSQNLTSKGQALNDVISLVKEVREAWYLAINLVNRFVVLFSALKDHVISLTPEHTLSDVEVKNKTLRLHNHFQELSYLRDDWKRRISNLHELTGEPWYILDPQIKELFENLDTLLDSNEHSRSYHACKEIERLLLYLDKTSVHQAPLVFSKPLEAGPLIENESLEPSPESIRAGIIGYFYKYKASRESSNVMAFKRH